MCKLVVLIACSQGALARRCREAAKLSGRRAAARGGRPPRCPLARMAFQVGKLWFGSLFPNTSAGQLRRALMELGSPPVMNIHVVHSKTEGVDAFAFAEFWHEEDHVPIQIV